MININDFLKLVDYKLKIKNLEAAVLQIPANRYQSFNIITPVFFYINNEKPYIIHPHKGIYKKKRHNIKVCEWALDKGYVSYSGISLNEFSTQRIYNPSIAHIYKLTDSGTDICGILFL
jgi:hypothetical protein